MGGADTGMQEAAILDAKYVNAVPLCRQEADLNQKGLPIIRAEIAHWTVLCGDGI